MNDLKIFVWILAVPAGEPPQTFVFSAMGIDRKEAEEKMVAYFKALPAETAPTNEKLIQWVQAEEPLIPEVREGVWLLVAPHRAVS